MEIPIAMILASRLLPFRANRLANIIAGSVMTLTNGFLTFVLPLTNGDCRDPAYPGTCSSGRSKLYAPLSSSGGRGLGHPRMPNCVRVDVTLRYRSLSLRLGLVARSLKSFCMSHLGLFAVDYSVLKGKDLQAYPLVAPFAVEFLEMQSSAFLSQR
jgi:hypothetical protein